MPRTKEKRTMAPASAPLRSSRRRKTAMLASGSLVFSRPFFRGRCWVMTRASWHEHELAEVLALLDALVRLARFGERADGIHHRLQGARRDVLEHLVQLGAPAHPRAHQREM